MEKVFLSTVTPVYRGGPYLEQLVAEMADLRRELNRQGTPLELVEAIFVDDASVDDSADVLAALADKHSWVKTVCLSRNFGQHPATVAGVLHSCGDWVATLDEDLQHPPRFLASLLGYAAAQSKDLAYAKPQDPVHGTRFRDLSSRLYKRLVSRIAGNPEITKFNSFRMIRGSVARAAASVSKHETYFDVALCWFTDRIGSLELPLKEVRHLSDQPSGYDLRKLLRHARRMLFSSEIKPLRAGGLIGLAALGVSLIGSLITLALRFFRPQVIDAPGWTSLILVVFFFGGLLCLLLGIALEHLSALHLQALGKPTFFVVDRSKDKLLSGLDVQLSTTSRPSC